MNQTRKHRGYRTQRALADHFKLSLWPHAEPVGAGAQGRDITGTPGVCIEVKARADFNPLAWIRQCRRHDPTGQDLPLVLFRPNGLGEENIGDWLAVLRIDDLTRLLQEAGYGTPTTRSEAA